MILRITAKISKVMLLLSMLFGLIGSTFAGHGVYLNMKANLAQFLLQQAWEESRLKGQGVPPWPWADTRPLARLEFLQQGESYIVLEGSSGRSLAFAPGHLSGSALPGEPGHTIISAHRDTHFSILEQVTQSTVFALETLAGKKHYYRVFDMAIVDTRTEPLLLKPETGFLTLITCYPFDAINSGSPYRYRIDAIPVSLEAITRPLI